MTDALAHCIGLLVAETDWVARLVHATLVSNVVVFARRNCDNKWMGWVQPLLPHSELTTQAYVHHCCQSSSDTKSAPKMILKPPVTSTLCSVSHSSQDHVNDLPILKTKPSPDPLTL